MGLLTGSVANKGRNGDTRIAHMTPGEVVIPREVAALRPDIIAHIANQVRSMGGNPDSLTVGRGRINPRTGIEEFATQAEVEAAYQSTLGRAPEAEGLAYWMGQSDLGAFKTAAAPEIASRVGSAYQQNFGREADTAGSDYWKSQVGAGNISSISDLNKTMLAGAGKDDVIASADKAQFATAWTPGTDPNSPLVYDPEKNKWNPPAEKKLELPMPLPVPAPTMGTASAIAPITRTLDQPTMTVAGQMEGLLSKDSRYRQMAETSAAQSANARGLLNTTMGVQAGEAAAIQSALPIAQQDATAYNAAASQNQTIENATAQFNANWTNDFVKLQQQQSNALAMAAFDANTRQRLQESMNVFNAGQNAMQQSVSSTANNTQYAQTALANLAKLPGDVSTQIVNISASASLDDAAKVASINKVIDGAIAQQNVYRAQLSALNFTPGSYFDFSTMRAKAGDAVGTKAAPSTSPTVVNMATVGGGSE